MSSIIDVTEFDKANSGCVIRMLPHADDGHPFYADYEQAVVAADALAARAPLHVSGRSGTGKSHFLNSLLLGPEENFSSICRGLDLPVWERVKCHRIFVSLFETPGEVWYRTEVVNFSTEERPQQILEVLHEAATDPTTLHVIWLVESGRGITESVQGGLLELVGQKLVREPRGHTFELSNCTFVTDSNHAANEAGEFVIFTLDQAYGRRWTRRITFDGLDPEQETMVLRELAPGAPDDSIRQVVSLAVLVRQKQSEGALQSILPPTIDAELDLLGCMQRLPLSTRRLVFSTMLGHCASRDMDEAETVYAEAFGVQVKATTPAAEAVGVL